MTFEATTLHLLIATPATVAGVESKASLAAIQLRFLFSKDQCELLGAYSDGLVCVLIFEGRRTEQDPGRAGHQGTEFAFQPRAWPAYRGALLVRRERERRALALFGNAICSSCRAREAAFGCEAVVKSVIALRQAGRVNWTHDCFAAERSLAGSAAATKGVAFCAGFFDAIASGALLVSSIDKRYLEVCVPIMLILVAIYFALSPKLANEDRRKRIGILLFSFTVAPVLGFYDGIFGPGVGSFFIVGFVLLCGLGMMRAMSFTKLANASCNLGSLSVFITKGVIIWPVAIAMALAAFVGAQLGARAAVRVGPRLIKPMLIVVCCALAIKLLSVETNPLRVALIQAYAGVNNEQP